MTPPLSSAASSSQPAAAATDASSGMTSARRLDVADIFRSRSPLCPGGAVCPTKKVGGWPTSYRPSPVRASWPSHYKEWTCSWQVAAEQNLSGPAGPGEVGGGLRRTALG